MTSSLLLLVGILLGLGSSSLLDVSLPALLVLGGDLLADEGLGGHRVLEGSQDGKESLVTSIV